MRRSICPKRASRGGAFAPIKRPRILPAATARNKAIRYDGWSLAKVCVRTLLCVWFCPSRLVLLDRMFVAALRPSPWNR